MQPLQEMGLTIGYVRRLQDMDDRDDITAYRNNEDAEVTFRSTYWTLPAKKTEDFLSLCRSIMKRQR